MHVVGNKSLKESGEKKSNYDFQYQLRIIICDIVDDHTFLL